MRSNSSKKIIINGVRYHVAIRLDTHWSYIAEWRTGIENRNPTLTETVQTDADAEQEASDAINKAHLKKEPWLYAEIACVERRECDASAINHHQDQNSTRK